MKNTPLAGIGSVAASLALLATAQADTVKMNYVPIGAMNKIGTYKIQYLTLSAQKPKGLKAPKGLSAPLYGVLSVGPQEKPTSYAVILDEPEGKDAHLYVDANSNGNFTDDSSVVWTRRSYKGNDNKQYTEYNGGATLMLKAGKDKMFLHLGMYRFDKRDTARAALKDQILYYRDYAYEGEITLGDKTYKAMLSDDAVLGDFRGKKDEAKGSGVNLLIDLDGDGKFKGRRETYDVAKPFNIAGVTYELSNISPSGNSFDFNISSRTVAEVPDLRVGKRAANFEVKTTEGERISFPSSYKGKIVLLDFWATWCGPCIAELPNLTKIYEKYHSRGFEVLGISLDQSNATEKLAAFTREKNMPWTQVYDGKYWDAEIAKLYLVTAIPQAYLIDGDTGEILADSSTLRGEPLDDTISKALEKKKL